MQPQARLQRVGDDVYYSPNCDRTLQFTVDPFLQTGENPFQPEQIRPLQERSSTRATAQNPARPTPNQRYTPKYPRFHTLCTPRVWTLAFGWLAFAPMRYWDTSYPFDRLKRIPPPLIQGHPDEATFSMPESVLDRWAQLEADLYGAVTTLKSKFEAPMVLPFLPWAHGYRMTFKQEESYRRATASSRNWFSVWWGALSFLIAYGESKRDPYSFGGTRLPLWHVALESVVDLAWIDGVFLSSVCDYSYNPNRIGCIIDISQRCPEQPPISWFIRHGIPVWYRWGPREASSSDPTLAPPPELLTGNPERPLLYNPSNNPPLSRPVPPPESASMDGPSEASQPAVKPEPAWVAHFKRHERMHKEQMKKETPTQRQAREARAANPPVSNVRVYEWWPSEKDPDVYERVPAGVKNSRDTLSLYSARQKIFDPFCREWDCCDHFGTGDGSVDLDEWGMEDLDLPLPSSLRKAIVDAHRQFFENDSDEDGPVDTVSPMTSSTMLAGSDPAQEPGDSDLSPITPSVFLPLQVPESSSVPDGRSLLDDEQGLFTVSRSWLAASLEMEVDSVFGLHYGFVPPLPSVEVDHPVDGRVRKEFYRLLGLSDNDDQPEEYLTSRHFQFAVQFMTAQSKRQAPPPASWDLREDVVRPLKISNRLQYLRILQLPPSTTQDIDNGSADYTPRYFYFDYPMSKRPWKLVVLSPVDALFICRLPSDFDEEDIVYNLAQRGMSYRLFVPRCSIPVTMYRTPSYSPLPVRPLKYKFTKADYNSYVNTRTLILAQPHMQAALRRGGFIWRLAVATLGLGEAQKTMVGCGGILTVRFPGSDTEYVEDGLTARELDLICDTGHTAVKSWWPLARAYERADCGENYGRWCNRREDWYLKRLANIENGVENFDQPLTFQQWKSSLRSLTSIRHFHQQLQSSSLEFIERHTHSLLSTSGP